MFVCLRWQTHSAMFFFLGNVPSTQLLWISIHGHHRHHPWLTVILRSWQWSIWVINLAFINTCRLVVLPGPHRGEVLEVLQKNNAGGIHRKDRGLCGFASDWCSFPFFEGVVFSFQYFFLLETVYDSLCVLDIWYPNTTAWEACQSCWWPASQVGAGALACLELVVGKSMVYNMTRVLGWY